MKADLEPVKLATRFGELVLEQDRILDFVWPLLGFESHQRYAAVDMGRCTWLQALSDADLAFPMVDPWEFFSDYRVELPEALLADLGAEPEGDLLLFCLVSNGPEGPGLNLAAPVVVNPATRRGGQVVLPQGSTYHPIARGSDAGPDA